MSYREFAMAKKKTAGPDTTETTSPPSTRRRATKGTATSVSARAMSSPISTAADASGNGHSSQDVPTYEQIAEAAYHRYLRRGGVHGADFDDWVEAERELRSRT